MSSRSVRFQLLATTLCLLFAPHLAGAQQALNDGTSTEPEPTTVRFDYGAAARAALDEAAAAASKIHDGAPSAIAMAQVADVTWSVDEARAEKLFKKAFDLATDEAARGGARGDDGRYARVRVARLYALHDTDAVIKQIDGGFDTPFQSDAPESAGRTRAELYAEIGLAIAESDPSRATYLARLSLDTGFVTPALCQLIGALPRDPALEILADAIRFAGYGPRASLVTLRELDYGARIFGHGPAGSASGAFSADIARLWAVSAFQVLDAAYAELVIARRMGRAPVIPAAELRAIADLRYFLPLVFSTYAPDLANRAEPRVDALASIAPGDAVLTTEFMYLDAHRLGVKAMLEIADKTPNSLLADALYRSAAFSIVSNEDDRRRDQSARLVVGKIRSDRLRTIASDEVVLEMVRQAAEKRRWSEAASVAGKLSDKDLRLQTYGALAHAAANVADAIAASLANDSRREVGTTFPTTRIVAALLSSSLAAASLDDGQAALADLRGALSILDRVDPSLDAARRPTPFDADFGATFGDERVSATTAPFVAELPLWQTFAAVATVDPVGLEGSAKSVRTLPRRVDVMVALAQVFLEMRRAEPTSR